MHGQRQRGEWPRVPCFASPPRSPSPSWGEWRETGGPRKWDMQLLSLDNNITGYTWLLQLCIAMEVEMEKRKFQVLRDVLPRNILTRSVPSLSILLRYFCTWNGKYFLDWFFNTRLVFIVKLKQLCNCLLRFLQTMIFCSIWKWKIEVHFLYLKWTFKIKDWKLFWWVRWKIIAV